LSVMTDNAVIVVDQRLNLYFVGGAQQYVLD
jgi:hypothetical protein